MLGGHNSRNTAHSTVQVASICDTMSAPMPVSPAAPRYVEPSPRTTSSAAASLLQGLSSKMGSLNNCLTSATQTQLSTVQCDLEEARAELGAARKVRTFFLELSFQMKGPVIVSYSVFFLQVATQTTRCRTKRWQTCIYQWPMPRALARKRRSLPLKTHWQPRTHSSRGLTAI